MDKEETLFEKEGTFFEKDEKKSIVIALIISAIVIAAIVLAFVAIANKKHSKTPVASVTETSVINEIPFDEVSDSGEIVVTTQEELNEALGKGAPYITIRTDETIEFTIDIAEYNSTTLTMDSPFASVVNNAVFQNIIINQIAANTWTENAKGNSFYINSPTTHLIINEDASVESIENIQYASTLAIENYGHIRQMICDASGSTTSIKIDGVIGELYVYTNTYLSLSGNTGEFTTVNMDYNASGTIFKTEVKVIEYVYSGIESEFTEGSEDSQVYLYATQDKNVITNNTEGEIMIIPTGEDMVALEAGEEYIHEPSEAEDTEGSSASESHSSTEIERGTPTVSSSGGTTSSSGSSTQSSASTYGSSSSSYNSTQTNRGNSSYTGTSNTGTSSGGGSGVLTPGGSNSTNTGNSGSTNTNTGNSGSNNQSNNNSGSNNQNNNNSGSNNQNSNTGSNNQNNNTGSDNQNNNQGSNNNQNPDSNNKKPDETVSGNDTASGKDTNESTLLTYIKTLMDRFGELSGKIDKLENQNKDLKEALNDLQSTITIYAYPDTRVVAASKEEGLRLLPEKIKAVTKEGTATVSVEWSVPVKVTDTCYESKGKVTTSYSTAKDIKEPVAYIYIIGEGYPFANVEKKRFNVLKENAGTDKEKDVVNVEYVSSTLYLIVNNRNSKIDVLPVQKSSLYEDKYIFPMENKDEEKDYNVKLYYYYFGEDKKQIETLGNNIFLENSCNRTFLKKNTTDIEEDETKDAVVEESPEEDDDTPKESVVGAYWDTGCLDYKYCVVEVEISE